MPSVEEKKLVCIGGGHGLGRLLESFKNQGKYLTGIVATTDEGGSTGRLREEADTIAWGDLRNCLAHLCSVPTKGQLLFDYRFKTQGDLNDHSLGNLILFALDQLSVRPTDAIQVMRDMLRIESHLFPMSDSPTTLMADTRGGDTLVGEIVIDDSNEDIERLYLQPEVNAEAEVITAIQNADALILSAGSFMTSIMPSLLVNNVASAINDSEAPLLLVANLTEEFLGGSRRLTFEQQLYLLQKSGIRSPDHILWPESRALINTGDISSLSLQKFDLKGEDDGLHDPERLKQAILLLLRSAN